MLAHSCTCLGVYLGINSYLHVFRYISRYTCLYQVVQGIFWDASSTSLYILIPYSSYSYCPVMSFPGSQHSLSFITVLRYDGHHDNGVAAALMLDYILGGYY